ncbi:MAG: purine-nucleoside/S-methyl-5-thioadenosine phosphorylase / adenosine deaminase [Thermoleophilaceae bacterium]|jgi:YfiH family protein|nr:purine-nucleoside/S-methyl-5-thioadenosine phosphorylase / adenosine deaminase [Thermoleophilaceae bacterium]
MIFDVDLPGGRAVFSTRMGGVSPPPYQSLNLGILTDDDQDRVAENRRLLATRVGLDPERVVWGRQVHGTGLQEWDGPLQGECRDVDGHLTSVPGLGLLVIVADCLPVALVAPGRAAMLHCGWRGLAGGIVERALERFEERPAAAIGPGIGRCCYEVGPEVLGAFAGLEGVASGRMLDLRAVARRKLEAAGVSTIEDVDLCTSCRADLFFSHRRDHGVTGRQGGIAWLS